MDIPYFESWSWWHIAIFFLLVAVPQRLVRYYRSVVNSALICILLFLFSDLIIQSFSTGPYWLAALFIGMILYVPIELWTGFSTWQRWNKWKELIRRYDFKWSTKYSFIHKPIRVIQGKIAGYALKVYLREVDESGDETGWEARTTIQIQVSLPAENEVVKKTGWENLTSILQSQYEISSPFETPPHASNVSRMALSNDGILIHIDEELPSHEGVERVLLALSEFLS